MTDSERIAAALGQLGATFSRTYGQAFERLRNVLLTPEVQVMIAQLQAGGTMGDDVRTLTNRMLAERAGWRDVRIDEGYIVNHDLFPDYLTSTDAALTLPLAADMYYSLDVPAENGGAKCAIWNQQPRSTDRGRLIEAEAVAPTAAEAVCAAWWAWMEAK